MRISLTMKVWAIRQDKGKRDGCLTGQRLPTRTLTYWRTDCCCSASLRLFWEVFSIIRRQGCLPFGPLCGCRYFCCCVLSIIQCIITFTAIRSVGCWCGSAAVLSIIRWTRCLCAISSIPSSVRHLFRKSCIWQH